MLLNDAARVFDPLQVIDAGPAEFINFHLMYNM
jgi:hypothetical protein